MWTKIVAFFCVFVCFTKATNETDKIAIHPFLIQPAVYIDPKDDFQKTPLGVRGQSAPKCGIREGNFLNRVVAGKAAEKGEFPWQVSIQLRKGFSFLHVCGGAILNEKFVITGAHCVHVLPAKDLSVVAGDYNLYEFEESEQRRYVEQIFIHNFDIATFSNDIALMKLDTPFVLDRNRSVVPICLPKRDLEFKGLAMVTGWGRLKENGSSPQLLQKATIPFIPQDECFEKYTRIGLSRLLNKCQVCAALIQEHKDACQGDSGGPLICLGDGDGEQYHLCGIVSWGIGCGESSYPGVYTSVPCYLDWITETLRKN